MSNSAKIAALNDALRRTFTGGRVMKTDGIDGLDTSVEAKVMRAVRNFAQFSGDNDPFSEHDFGSIEVDDHRVLFKIDYFEKGSQLSAGAEHPENSETTERVLTIMLAEEY